jgi:hypothetical protein
LKVVEKFLKNKNLNFKKVNLELEYNTVKYAKIDNVKLRPLTLCNFNFENEILPVYFLKETKGENFAYITALEKKAVILLKKDLNEETFTGSYPVLRLNKPVLNKKFQIELKLKKIKRKINYIYTDIGYGIHYINLFIPLNSNTFKVSQKLIEKFIKLGYVRGLRVRFIFFYKNFLNNITEINKNIKENSLIDIFVDSGFYNDVIPVVYKYNGKILLTNDMITKILIVENKLISKLKFLSKCSFDFFHSSKNFLWFFPEEEEFKFLTLDEKSTEFISSNLYSFVKFLGKHLIK